MQAPAAGEVRDSLAQFASKEPLRMVADECPSAKRLKVELEESAM